MKKIILLILLFPVLIYAQSPFGEIVVTTRLSETYYDKNGNILTGKGVVVGDVDSGVDVFHPMFFFADGGKYEWIDVESDGKFTQGIDGIDFNGNNVIDANEQLRILKMRDETWGMLGPSSASFTIDKDFLYLDANGNGYRDYGPKSGFKESDPTYGELLFIAIDENDNKRLDVQETLIALKTSKIRAVREKDGNIRRRGIDLIETEPDSVSHGTGVAGIVMGGHYGVQRIHGIAPDAEMVFANIKYEYTPRFVRNFPDLINFLIDEEVNVILIEDGEWGWEFMDGSTMEEQMLNEYVRNGKVVIGGAGNLAGANMHLKDTLKSGEKKSYSITCPEMSEGKINDGVFTSFIWTDKDNFISFQIETPDGNKTPLLTKGSEIIETGKYNIIYSRDVSQKGTVMFRFGFSRSDSGSVEGNWTFDVTSEKVQTINGYVVDVSQSWAGNSHWNEYTTDETTVTFPCTGDSVIAVGAYTVNFPFSFDEEINDLSYYSGRGYNITGKIGPEITAPGHSTFSLSPNNGITIFSGTSSAAPHVVGAVCLLLQYEPTLNQSEIKEILFSSATQDKFTGEVPNSSWGWGKLNIEAALKMLKNK
ncbi:MAG: S8 family serine peptidase [Ignavibacteriaceae bacterium]|jgi:subtilisin family serine protease|nr:MAG: Bacillopeptidase F [Chlorobi bacterium OLB4]MBW7855677.1 S8 family serine peptidase [Ignavibacteria bacterium]MEB2328680.1 S8 family serine peptidase [Ignavibacteriaceae bacterium]OQY78600.1 MAG: hypothetical protein B6D43_02035 [Ignavibacteriales bacterium UTCHB1]